MTSMTSTVSIALGLLVVGLTVLELRRINRRHAATMQRIADEHSAAMRAIESRYAAEMKAIGDRHASAMRRLVEETNLDLGLPSSANPSDEKPN